MARFRCLNAPPRLFDSEMRQKGFVKKEEERRSLDGEEFVLFQFTVDG